MKPKAKIKLAVDIFMTLALLFLMGYHLWGEALHEWVGAGMFVLFIAHHILNGNWHKALFKGKYNKMRVLMLVIDSFVLASMLAQMYSGIVMSRHVFAFLPIDSKMALARRLHILGAYWGFLFMSLHLGLHWSMILGLIKSKNKVESHSIRIICFVLGLAVAAYGAWVFVKRDFFTYLFLQSEFVFLDYEESKILYYIDYLSLMGMCIFISHYMGKLVRRRKRKEGSR